MTRRCPIPPPHALRFFFLAACFFGVRGKVKNFFLLQLPLHCDGRGKKSRSGEDLKHAHWTCYVVVCASSPFSARKRRSVGRGRCGRRRVGVSGDGEEGNTTQHTFVVFCWSGLLCTWLSFFFKKSFSTWRTYQTWNYHIIIHNYIYTQYHTFNFSNLLHNIYSTTL